MYTGGNSDTALLENMGTEILKDNLACQLRVNTKHNADYGM